MPENITTNLVRERLKYFRFTFNAAPEMGTPLEMPRAIPLVAGLIAAVMFAIFAGVWWVQFSRLHLDGSGDVGSLMGSLFSLFWLMGWSIGVLFLAVVTFVLLFFREGAWLSGGRLVSVMTVGPLGVRGEYELARMRNLRVEDDRDGRTARIRFDYDGMACSIGNMMPPEVAARNLKLLQGVVPGNTFDAEPIAAPAPAPAPAVASVVPGYVPEQHGLPWLSMLTLIVANLIPLFMVLSGGWTLGQVMMLFWAESAVIGGYTLLKMAVVAKWWAIFPGVFFLGHFGGFMAIHFLFIYELFLRGLHAGLPGPAAWPELLRLFAPLQWALLALVVSHGVSFVLNFILRAEHEGERVQSLMMAPYGRIVVMQLTLILGGWVVMLLHDPRPVLALLVVIKILADLNGHYGERTKRKGSGEQGSS